MKVCVHGLGNVGLPMALLLATEHEVVGVDVDADLVAELNGGDLPTDEPGLEALSGVSDFTATTAPVSADFHVIATPTSLDADTRLADLHSVRDAVEALTDVLEPGDVVVLVSTVPPGTTERLVAPIVADAAPDVGIAYSPERALPGNTVEEMCENDRLVGCDDPETAARVTALYETFVEGEITPTDPRTAEFVKLMENTYRDVNIALANEFAMLAESAGIDVHEARRLSNRHPRVDVLEPGPGVGGHCLAVDPWFLIDSASNARLVPTAREINDGMADHVLRLVRRAVPEPDARVAVLGAAYKGDVADTRQTPTRRVVHRLENDGYEVAVTDPHVESFDPPVVPLPEAATGAAGLVLVTDHAAYHDLDPDRIGDLVADRRLVDTRNHLDAAAWRSAGFDVAVLGDGTSQPSDDRR